MATTRQRKTKWGPMRNNVPANQSPPRALYTEFTMRVSRGGKPQARLLRRVARPSRPAEAVGDGNAQSFLTRQADKHDITPKLINAAQQLIEDATKFSRILGHLQAADVRLAEEFSTPGKQGDTFTACRKLAGPLVHLGFAGQFH